MQWAILGKPETGVISYQPDSDLTFKSAGFVSKNVDLAMLRNDHERFNSLNISPICCKTPYLTCDYEDSTHQRMYCVTKSTR